MDEEKTTVYLDNSNLSLVPEEVVDAMKPYWKIDSFGHPALVHEPGRKSLQIIEKSRKEIADTIHGSGEEIIFTSGLTEANNLALQGAAYAHKQEGDHIIISKVEAPSVARTANLLDKEGFQVEEIDVNEKGSIKLDQLQEMIRDDTILISISGVADEIGTIEPLKGVKDIIEDKDKNILFHSDFSNGYTKIPVNVEELGLDLLSVGGRKIHGPPGIGFLFVREGKEINKIMEGALTTNKLRPGFENFPLIMGMRKAIELAFEKTKSHLSVHPKHNEKIRRLRDRLYAKIEERVGDILLNGAKGKKRSPSNLNISFKRVEGEAITLKLSKRGIYVSTGSACARRSLTTSPILIAIGVNPEFANSSIIFELSRYNNRGEIDFVADTLPDVISKLREVSAFK